MTRRILLKAAATSVLTVGATTLPAQSEPAQQNDLGEQYNQYQRPGLRVDPLYKADMTVSRHVVSMINLNNTYVGWDGARTLSSALVDRMVKAVQRSVVYWEQAGPQVDMLIYKVRDCDNPMRSLGTAAAAVATRAPTAAEASHLMQLIDSANVSLRVVAGLEGGLSLLVRTLLNGLTDDRQIAGEISALVTPYQFPDLQGIQANGQPNFNRTFGPEALIGADAAMALRSSELVLDPLQTLTTVLAQLHGKLTGLTADLAELRADLHAGRLHGAALEVPGKDWAQLLAFAESTFGADGDQRQVDPFDWANVNLQNNPTLDYRFTKTMNTSEPYVSMLWSHYWACKRMLDLCSSFRHFFPADARTGAIAVAQLVVDGESVLFMQTFRKADIHPSLLSKVFTAPMDTYQQMQSANQALIIGFRELLSDAAITARWHSDRPKAPGSATFQQILRMIEEFIINKIGLIWPTRINGLPPEDVNEWDYIHDPPDLQLPAL